MKTLFKESFLCIKKTFKRFLSLLLIVLLGVGFFVGIRSTSPDMKESLDTYFKDQNVYDIFVSSTWGISSDEIDKLNELGYKAEGSYSFDAIIESDNEYAIKVLSYDKDATMNKLIVDEGRLPENNNECVIESGVHSKLYSVGDKITVEDDLLKETELTIVGKVSSPLYISRERGSTKLLSGTISFYIYVPISDFDSEYYTESYIKLDNNYSLTSKSYEKLVDSKVADIKTIVNDLGKNRYNSELKDASDELNDKIDEYNTEKTKAFKKISDAQKEIDSNRKTIKNGITKLNSEEKKAKSTFASKKSEINSNIKSVSSAITTLETNISYLESIGQTDQANILKPQLTSLKSNLKALKDGYQTLLKTEKETYAKIKANRTKLNNGLSKLNKAQVTLNKNKKEAEEKFDDAWEKIEDAQEEIDDLEAPEWYVLDLDSNIGFYQYSQDAERISNIAKVFPLLFYVVAILICLTSMTRMVEEERGELGTLKSLGYEDYQIMFKYIFYAFLATLFGSIFGIFAGLAVIPKIICNMYATMYNIGGTIYSFHLGYALAGTLIAMGCILFATIHAVKKSLKEVPAELMRPASPKAGKRVLLERITFIWKRLSFSKKVTVRNVFRYKKRFLMTIFGISGCTGLILAGFGLQDCITGMVPSQYHDLFNYQLEITLDSKKSLTERNSDYDEIIKLTEIKDSLKVEKESVEITNYDNNQTIILVVPFGDISNFIKLQDRKSKTKYSISDNSVIVSEKLAELLDLSIGDTLNLDADNNYEVKVENITENYLMHYIYMNKTTYNSDEYNTILVRLDDMTEKEKKDFSKKLSKFDSISSLTFNSVNEGIFDGVMDNFKSVSSVLIISAGLLAFVVLYNLSSINISERKRELASIKVLGFYDNEVYKYVSRENTILTIIGIALGCGVGKLLTMYIIKTCELDITMFNPTVSLNSYIYSILITLVFTCLVDVVTYIALKKIKMVESLKSVE